MQTSAFHRLLPAVEHRAHQTCLKSDHVRSAAWQVVKLPPTDDAGYRHTHDRQTPDKKVTSPQLLYLQLPVCVWASELCTMIGFARRDFGAGSMHVIAPCNHETGLKQKEKKRRDYIFWHQFNEKPSITPGRPGMRQETTDEHSR